MFLVRHDHGYASWPKIAYALFFFSKILDISRLMAVPKAHPRKIQFVDFGNGLLNH